MKRGIFIVLTLTLAWSALAAQPLTMGTYNLRIRTPKDSVDGPWEQRLPYVAKNLHAIGYDIVGVQELIDTLQANDLKQAMGSDYALLYQGRESNTEQKGESLGFLYRPARIQVLRHGHFHVSPTPDNVSIGWDARKYRICMWAECLDKRTHKTFYFFSTHLDHKGIDARNLGAAFVAQKIKEIAGNSPYILVGDMNSSLVNFPDVYTAFTANMYDAREISKRAPKGPYATYSSRFVNLKNGFQDIPEHRLDYIFVSSGKVKSYEVITEDFGQPILPSDHFPLVIKYQLAK